MTMEDNITAISLLAIFPYLLGVGVGIRGKSTYKGLPSYEGFPIMTDRMDGDCQRRVRYEDNALVCERCPNAADCWPACAGTGPVSSTERGAARE